MLDCSHQVSHMHDCHNKDEVSSFEQYCDIIAKMKISHDPKMQIVSRILSDVDFPMLNEAAHGVKEGFRRTSADCCKNGGTESIQHAYDKASGSGGNIQHACDKASRTSGDIGMSTRKASGTGGDIGMSINIDGDKGGSMRQGNERQGKGERRDRQEACSSEA